MLRTTSSAEGLVLPLPLLVLAAAQQAVARPVLLAPVVALAPRPTRPGAGRALLASTAVAPAAPIAVRTRPPRCRSMAIVCPAATFDRDDGNRYSDIMQQVSRYYAKYGCIE